LARSWSPGGWCPQQRGRAYFEFVNGIFGSFLGRLVLFGFTWALMHHMLGGIRHFIWDTGYGFDHGGREWLARATIIGSLHSHDPALDHRLRGSLRR
jgi:succinate dehydrogenase cytochrome b556 subunit